ncbi:Pentatricopeptide repeat [Quillaja saponaria]|uniref:Pentatricopeptide repeat n=1 Tax=Quillaja saponaria TaxID=32244 RepID=A0AAD7QGV5_QUISA|nr:Pentatricopeptide repeat [Quillaja saponaria]
MSLPAKTDTATLIQLSQPPKPATLISLKNQTQSTVNPTNFYRKQWVSLKHSTKPVDRTVAWTSSIAHHSRKGKLAEAAAEFERMRLAGVEPNHITFITLLSGCADFPLEIASFGASIHGYTRKLDLDVNNVMVGTAIVDMYAKCGQVGLARSVFDQMGVKNSVSFNTMIDGYMRNGDFEDAIKLFDQMPVRSAISWTALIGGFVKKNYHEQALECFREMQLSGVKPDYVTIISVIAACANLGTFGLGLWFNRFVMKEDFRDNIRISNSLIDMYSRCGCIDFARQIFEKMSERTLVSWNSIIVGFAVNGHADEALKFFTLMQREGFKPDGVTFTGALTAFRAGRLEDAMNVIRNMPMKPNEVVLGSLLAACRSQADVGLAERLMNYLVELDPGVDSNYVLLANIYAAVGKWDGASKVRRTMKARGIQKTPGSSSVEIDSTIHKFVAGDKSHLDTEPIYEVLDLLSLELKLCGYVPETTTNESNEDD